MLAERMRTGAWVTATRLRVYPLIYLGASLAIAVAAIAFGHGMRDALGQPLGTDFLCFWSASDLLWQGRPAAAYDPASLYTIEQAVAGPDSPLYAWFYPPMALLVLAPLAALPYLPALVLWLGITLTGYLSTLWQLLPERRALLPMIAFQPVFITLGHGQNSFLSATLLGWGLLLLPRHPWFGGVLLGTLSYKPQLGLLLPVALLAARNRRALLGAGLSAVTLVALSFSLLGAEVWAAFLATSGVPRLVLEQGVVPWQKMISGFAAARMLGASVGLAWTVQALLSLVAAASVWRVWRGPAPHPIKIAALAAGSLLATPFAFDYDATLLGLALAALVAEGLRRGFLDWEISALAAAWLMPLCWRPLAVATDIPSGMVTVVLVLWLTTRRAAIAESQSGPASPAA